MNTQKNTQTNESPVGKLTRVQATWVSDWLNSQGMEVQGGWMGVWQMYPQQIAKAYKVNIVDVEDAARGLKRGV